MIEIGMGSVQVGECDVMGHMNVRYYVSRALEAMAWGGMRLVVVTHHVGDIPDCISHGLLLEKGHIVVQGGLEQVRAHPASHTLLVEDENHRERMESNG